MSNELVIVKPTAITKGIGETIVKQLAGAIVAENKAQAQLHQAVKAKKQEIVASAVQAILKAARADKTIDLHEYVIGDRGNIRSMNEKLYLALDLKAPRTIGEGDKARQVLDWKKEVAPFFPSKGDKPDAPSTKAKHSFRTNLAHTLTLAAQSAYTLLTKEIEVKLDKEGTMRVSGKAIENQFGSPSVLINEKATQGTDKSPIHLSARPTFTALANMSKPEGVPRAGRVTARAGSTVIDVKLDAQDAVREMCLTLIKTIEKLDTSKAFKTETINALTSARSAIDRALS